MPIYIGFWIEIGWLVHFDRAWSSLDTIRWKCSKLNVFPCAIFQAIFTNHSLINEGTIKSINLLYSSHVSFKRRFKMDNHFVSRT